MTEKAFLKIIFILATKKVVSRGRSSNHQINDHTDIPW